LSSPDLLQKGATRRTGWSRNENITDYKDSIKAHRLEIDRQASDLVEPLRATSAAEAPGPLLKLRTALPLRG
jgi:hypothetical protein